MSRITDIAEAREEIENLLYSEQSIENYRLLLGQVLFYTEYSIDEMRIIVSRLTTLIQCTFNITDPVYIRTLSENYVGRLFLSAQLAYGGVSAREMFFLYGIRKGPTYFSMKHSCDLKTMEADKRKFFLGDYSYINKKDQVIEALDELITHLRYLNEDLTVDDLKKESWYNYLALDSNKADAREWYTSEN